MRKRTTSSFRSMGGERTAPDEVNRRFRMWRTVNKWIDRILLSVLIFLMVFMGSGLIDEIRFLGEGIGGVKYHSFTQLLKINPDTVAWITLDGTHIDNPVVSSRDNFDYLDKGFDGKYYAGGTLFMDKDGNSFEDRYCIIHGHHMAAGAMFGDLAGYLEQEFFEKNMRGTLLTPEYDYDLTVFAAGVFDAYDGNIYEPGDAVPESYIKENTVNQREADDPAHVLALSTCHDDMTDNRIVVFCSMTNKRRHR